MLLSLFFFFVMFVRSPISLLMSGVSMITTHTNIVQIEFRLNYICVFFLLLFVANRNQCDYFEF